MKFSVSAFSSHDPHVDTGYSGAMSRELNVLFYFILSYLILFYFILHCCMWTVATVLDCLALQQPRINLFLPHDSSSNQRNPWPPRRGLGWAGKKKKMRHNININISSENHKTITRLWWKQTSGAPSTPSYLSFIATYVSSHKSCFNFFLKQSHHSSTNIVTCNFYKSMCHIKLCYFQENYGWKCFF